MGALCAYSLRAQSHYLVLESAWGLDPGCVIAQILISCPNQGQEFFYRPAKTSKATTGHFTYQSLIEALLCCRKPTMLALQRRTWMLFKTWTLHHQAWYYCQMLRSWDRTDWPQTHCMLITWLQMVGHGNLVAVGQLKLWSQVITSNLSFKPDLCVAGRGFTSFTGRK